MMDAIMQMKEQIQQVMVNKQPPNPLDYQTNHSGGKRAIGHEEYLIMQRMSRNELDYNHAAGTGGEVAA